MALRKNNSDEDAASQNVEPEEVKEIEETVCLSTIAQDAVNKCVGSVFLCSFNMLQISNTGE